MIIFKKLWWSNFFCYGEDNEIDFLQAPVTQLVGLNGVGKTSIPIILQEVLFSKNVKKIIKSNLLNRYSENLGLSAGLHFSADEINYELIMTRKGAKLTIQFFKDNEDISSHTAPATIKTIENVLGIDFDTFCQLVYQSSKSSLQFLTATDTQRKKFLITLFNLERYIEIYELFKIALINVNKQVAEVNGRYTVYEEWLNSHKVVDTEKELLDVPDMPEQLEEQLGTLKHTKSSAELINKTVNKNNSYHAELNSLDKELLTKQIHNPPDIVELKNNKISITTRINEKQKIIKKIDALSDICYVCKQPIDIGDSKTLAEKYRREIEILKIEIDETITKLKFLENLEQSDNKVRNTIKQFENLTNLIDDTVQRDTVDVNELDINIKKISQDILVLKEKITKIKVENEKINIFNAKLTAQEEQRKEYSTKLLNELNILEELFEQVMELEILKEAFGTNGLVSYKLEYLTKDLELVINEYLTELSHGRFQLSFLLKGDKLNIEVIDEGKIITINEVSEGELAKISVSTLLAIRKLMQNLSNTKLNLLFLDEIMGVLDSYGREDLIRILLAEESLNTYLVTHEYRHPLVPVINVIQENKISRIEYD